MSRNTPAHRGGDSTIPLDRLQTRLLPLADLVMVAMLSRPSSGTLRTTRVTAVTIVLAGLVGAVSLVLIPVIALHVAGGHSPLWLALTPALLAVGTGCACLAMFGVRQRYLLRASATP